MRIGIEAQRLFRRNKHGMDIVALELIQALQKIDTVNEYFIFVKNDEDRSCLQETKNFKIIVTQKYPYAWWEQVLLRKLSKQYQLDLLHCTSNTAPIGLPIAMVVTIHDIIYLERINPFKGSLYQIFGNLYRRMVVPLIIRKAKRIITVSDFEKKVMGTRFPNLTPHTVYNAINNSFKELTDAALLTSAKQQFSLPDNFIFYLGNTDPKKNLVGTLKAFSLLVKKIPDPPKLVILDINKPYLDRLINNINPALTDHIKVIGYVPNQSLPAIYTLAKIFLYPSLRESFGIPLLEAMACGTPIITSNTSAIPEIVKDAALLVNPFNPEEIALAVENLLNNPNLLTNLVSNGYKRVKDFSWERNARQTLEIYKEVYQKSAVA